MSVQRVHAWCNAAAPPRPPILFRSFSFWNNRPLDVHAEKTRVRSHKFYFRMNLRFRYFLYTQFLSIFAQMWKFSIFSSNPEKLTVLQSLLLVNRLFFPWVSCIIKFVANFRTVLRTYCKNRWSACDAESDISLHVRCSAQSDKTEQSRSILANLYIPTCTRSYCCCCCCSRFSDITHAYAWRAVRTVMPIACPIAPTAEVSPYYSALRHIRDDRRPCWCTRSMHSRLCTPLIRESRESSAQIKQYSSLA